MSKKKQNVRVEDDGTYVVPQNRKMNVFALVVCFLAAVLIWIYATNMENKEKAEEQETSTSTMYAAELVDSQVL